MKRLFRLGVNVAVEPLIDGWPAWLMLADPVSAGYYRRWHLELLQSFLASPGRHLAAAADTRLTGGSFCDLAGVPHVAVADYAAIYRELSQPYLRFAEDLEVLARRLDEAPAADALPGYADLPDSLRGRVELRFDAVGRQSARLLRGPAAVPALNGAAVWLDGSARPGFMATPRLAADGRAHVLAVDPADVQNFAALQHAGATRAYCEKYAAAVGIADPEPLLTLDRANARVGAEPRFLGHASIALPLGDGWLISDPVSASANAASSGLADVRVVVISHGHPDHFSPEALIALVVQQPVVVVPASGSISPLDPGIKPALQRMGFRTVVELRPYEAYGDGELSVLALPFLGEHGELAIDGKAVFHVGTGRLNVVLAADTSGLDPQVFARSEAAGQTDALVIGIEPAGARAGWLYGPVLSKGAAGRRLAAGPLAGANAQQVLAIAAALRAPAVRIYGTGAPGMRHILGRSALNASRAHDELRKLLTLPGTAELDVQILDRPGQPLCVRGSA